MPCITVPYHECSMHDELQSKFEGLQEMYWCLDSGEETVCFSGFMNNF